jgi:hypothetical protein
MGSGRAQVVLLERGQAVEQRGKDIGALFARGIINPDSNLCYGQIPHFACSTGISPSNSVVHAITCCPGLRVGAMYLQVKVRPLVQSAGWQSPVEITPDCFLMCDPDKCK